MRLNKKKMRAELKRMCLLDLLVYRELIDREINAQVREFGKI